MARHDMFFIAAVFFLFGVLLASFDFSFFAVLSIVLLFSALCILLCARKLFFFLAGLSIFILFGWGYFVYRDLQYQILVIPSGSRVIATGTVVSDPYVKNGVQVFTLQTDDEYKRLVRVVAKHMQLFRYNDVLRVYGYAEHIESAVLSRYFRKEGVHVSLAFPRVIFERHNDEFSVRGVLFSIKRKLAQGLYDELPRAQASLAAGLLLGDTSGFSKVLTDSFRASGTSHIVALSGYNIQILISMVFAVLLRFFRRRLAFFVSFSISLLFVLMTGAQASLVRAFFMAFLVLLARELGRVSSNRNVLILAAFLMVLYDPSILVFDLGFQLSFLALIGVTYLAPYLMSFFETSSFFAPVLIIFIFSFAAELAVAPLLLLTFSSLSLIGPIVNLLILPLVPLVMFFCFLLTLSYLFLPYLTSTFSFIAEQFLNYFLFVIHLGASYNPEFSVAFYWLILGIFFLGFSFIVFLRLAFLNRTSSD